MESVQNWAASYEHETEASLRQECLQDLQDAAAALEAVVTTVAAAVEHREGGQPSDGIVRASFHAVCALLSE